jgi:hypothetical protein
MGKKGGGSTTTTSKQSSGNSKSARAKKALCRVKMKIARWERYKNEGKKPTKGSKRTGWDTSGLKEHAKFLQSMI